MALAHCLKTCITIFTKNPSNDLQWNLCIMDTLGLKKYPDYQGVLIFQVVLYEKCHIRPQLSVWIMQESLFSSVHINRFHSTYSNSYPIITYHAPSTPGGPTVSIRPLGASIQNDAKPFSLSFSCSSCHKPELLIGIPSIRSYIALSNYFDFSKTAKCTCIACSIP